MKPCRTCRTLYPDIMPEADELCRDCLAQAEWETVDLHDVAAAMEQELERWRPMEVAVEIRR